MLIYDWQRFEFTTSFQVNIAVTTNQVTHIIILQRKDNSLIYYKPF